MDLGYFNDYCRMQGNWFYDKLFNDYWLPTLRQRLYKNINSKLSFSQLYGIRLTLGVICSFAIFSEYPPWRSLDNLNCLHFLHLSQFSLLSSSHSSWFLQFSFTFLLQCSFSLQNIHFSLRLFNFTSFMFPFIIFTGKNHLLCSSHPDIANYLWFFRSVLWFSHSF